MKTFRRLLPITYGLLGLITAIALPGRAHAGAPPLDYLLTVDVSDPASVTITATGFAPLMDSSATNNNDGIDLLNFFAASTMAEATQISTLTPAGGSVPYDTWSADNFSGSNRDLNIYTNSGTSTQNFTTVSAAFTGVFAGMDMSSLVGNLPAAGASGDLLAGWSENNDGIIGQWLVVPEPSQKILLVLGIAGFALARRALKGSHRSVRA